MEHLLTRVIKLNTIENLNTFCNLANEILTDIDVRQGHYIVNGKSILGLMSLNLLCPIVVEYDTGSYDFENFLNENEVK